MKLLELNIVTIEDITDLIDDSEFKIKFLEYKNFVIKKMESAYVTIDTDNVRYFPEKEEHIRRGVLIRCIEYIFLNNMKIYEKYIDKQSLSDILDLKNFIYGIINENNTEIIFEKYFKCYKVKRSTAKTFTM